jgi:hypothetical protein
MPERYLDNIELNDLGTPRAQFVEYRGVLDQAALREACEFVCRRYPLLRAHVRPENGRRLLVIPPDFQAGVRVVEGGHAVLQQELERDWDNSRGIAELALVQHESRGFVVLRADIGLIDGRGWTAMFDELFGFYTALVESRPVAGEPENSSLPVSAASLWESRCGVAEPEGPSESPHLPAIQIDCRLDREDTARLLAAARARGVSMHALISGVVLTNLCAEGGQTGQVPMVCLSAVDLRHRVSPPVGPTETTKFVGWHRADVLVSPESDPFVVGGEVKAQLSAAIDGGALRPVHPDLDLTTPLDPRLSRVVIPNLGILQPLEHPQDITIVNRTRYIGSHRPYPWYAIYTFQEELNIIAVYTVDRFTRDEAEKITARLVYRLQEIAG